MPPLAGRDTTAATLTIVVYFLSQYPHIMKRLRQEVLDTVGPTRRPTFDDIRAMKYLRAVLNGEYSHFYQYQKLNISQRLSAFIPSFLSMSGRFLTSCSHWEILKPFQ
jgi:hypothetical protein